MLIQLELGRNAARRARLLRVTRLAAALWCSAALAGTSSGCGREALQGPSPRAAAQLPQKVLDTTPSGLRVASLPRATSGVLRLALYIDAGSRDAALPQTATMAAWLAAEAGGAQLEATVFPDVTEIALGCTADQLDHCIAQLARALALRTPPADGLGRVRNRLRDGQRRALASDPYAGVDRIALHALLGDAAPGFFPLGTPEVDPVVAADAVSDFLRDHYGPTRTLTVAAGDIQPEHVRDAVTQAFNALPQASRARTPRGLMGAGAAADPRIEVTMDDRSALSIALEATGTTQLRDVAQRLAEALAGDEPRIAVAGRVFPARTGALALLHVDATQPDLALARAARELSRLQVEPSPQLAPPIQEDDLVGSSRELGLAFGAEGAPAPHTFRFAAGLALAAGFDAGPAAKAQQLTTSEQRMAQAQGVWQSAVKRVEPKTRGEIDNEVAAVTLDNGAAIDVQFTRGDMIAFAIRVGLGAEQDLPLLHGQAALLATLTTTACAGMGLELLHSRFKNLGAELEPRVDSESYGLLVRVPNASFEPALDLALRCMRSPSRVSGDIVEAGALLRQRLRRADRALVLRASAANLVVPRAPGVLAPWGDPERIANVTARDLDQALRATQLGQRWAVAIVGAVDVRASVALVARRLADLAGSSDKPTSGRADKPLPVLPTTLPHNRDGDGIKLLAVWTAQGPSGGELGARVFARATATLLAAVPGIDVLSQDAAAHQTTSFAALGLRVRPDLAAALPALLTGAARSVDDAWLEKALVPLVAQAASAQSAEQARFATRAEQVARQRLGARFGQPNADSAARVVKALRDSRPGIAPLP